MSALGDAKVKHYEEQVNRDFYSELVCKDKYPIELDDEVVSNH